MKYVAVYEQTPNNWAAYVPDLPGCVAVGDSRQEVESQIREAIALHIAGLRADDEAVPQPGAWSGLVEVDEAKVRVLSDELRAEWQATRK